MSSFSGMHTSLKSWPFVALINWPSSSDVVSVWTVRRATNAHPAAESQFLSCAMSHIYLGYSVKDVCTCVGVTWIADLYVTLVFLSMDL